MTINPVMLAPPYKCAVKETWFAETFGAQNGSTYETSATGEGSRNWHITKLLSYPTDRNLQCGGYGRANDF